MTNNISKVKQTAKYVAADWFSALLTWILFYFFRKFHEDPDFRSRIGTVFDDANFWIAIAGIPVCWVGLYMLTGFYNNVFKRSRLKELRNTFFTVLCGSVVLFFATILNDTIISYKTYYLSFTVLFCLQFFITFSFRYVIMTRTNKKIHNREIGFNTLIVGSHDNACDIYNEIEKQRYSEGNRFVGFVNVIERDEYKLEKHLPRLGDLSNVAQVIKDYQVAEVIIAFERSEIETIDSILVALQECDVVIKMTPMMQEFYLGSIKQEGIWHAPLLRVSPEPLPLWQKVVKRGFDVIVSGLVVTLLSPLYLFVAYKVKRSSPGPVFYRQERIGLHGKPFDMLKFRSMYVNAEDMGPQLSKDDDPRITPWGKFMRKVRLDEIPQFFTVLKGDMSIVGYRPERQFFIDQIAQRAPHYRMLMKIKPGITSWGEVKFGYASTVDEMVERLKYDILYLENMSIGLDLKILIYTVKIVIQGRGK